MRRALLVIGFGLLAMAPAAPASAACNFRKVAELPVSITAAGPTVPLRINGVDARLIADSGAFFSLLTPESVKRLGLPAGAVPGGFTIRGVNGRARVQVVEAKQITVGDAPFHNVDFLVGGAGAARGVDGFLGESFLGSMDVEYDLGHGVMRLFKAEGCGEAPLIYWNGAQPYSTVRMERRKFGPHDIEARARLNGADVHAVLDTGAWRSILTMEAAARAGVKPDGPGVQPAGMTGGLGSQPRATWIGPFDSFAFGDEEVRGARMLFGELELADADMLLGRDFFMSHRVLIANSQQRIYFTREDPAPLAPPTR
jgi:predicted aspartyl protease